MSNHFGIGGNGYSFFDEKFAGDSSTTVSHQEKSWLHKANTGGSTFWGSRVNDAMPLPAAMKGVATGYNLGYKKSASAPKNVSVSALTKHCQSGEVEAIVSIIRKATIAGTSIDLNQLDQKESMHPLAIAAKHGHGPPRPPAPTSRSRRRSYVPRGICSPGTTPEAPKLATTSDSKHQSAANRLMHQVEHSTRRVWS